ncbi:MAG: N-acetyltransferase [Sphingobacteriales bacterium]|nr:MAG: N-acetyltransferase [Sphingobacteriales bacterium]
MEKPVFNFSETIILENERARLEPLAEKHFPALAHIASTNTGLLKYSPSNIETKENFEKYMQAALDLREKQERYTFVIFDKKYNEIVGSTAFLSVSNYDQKLEIGATWLGREFQSTGINTNIKFLMLQYAFETLHFKRVEFRIHNQNFQSRRAVEKLGAKYEGELRSHMLMPDGSRRTSVYYSILDNEWPEIKTQNFSL